MKETVALLVVMLSLIGHAPYLIKTIRGRIKPNPISWLIWSISSMVTLLVVSSNGAGAATWSLYLGVSIQIITCFFAFRNSKKHRATRFDILSFIAAVSGLVIWIFSDRPAIAMLLITTVEIVGWLPTIRKSWKKPREEDIFMWGMGILQLSLYIIALTSYNFTTVFNAITWVFCYAITIFVLLYRRKTLYNSFRLEKAYVRPLHSKFGSAARARRLD